MLSTIDSHPCSSDVPTLTTTTTTTTTSVALSRLQQYSLVRDPAGLNVGDKVRHPSNAHDREAEVLLNLPSVTGLLMLLGAALQADQRQAMTRVQQVLGHWEPWWI